MKKIGMIFIFCLATSLVVSAQEYKRFKVGMGFGYGQLRHLNSDGVYQYNGSYYVPLYPVGGTVSYNVVLINLEPAYRVTDRLSIALRFEAALGPRIGEGLSGIGSITINSQYYLSANKFRPFVGAGIGSYGSTSQRLGFYPKVGFDAGHFSMSLDYNFIPATEASSSEQVTSYFGMKIGFFVGGGKK